MEAYESFVALAMETEGLVVSEAIKFPVGRKTRKTSHDEFQIHGFEVDLIGARRDKLVLATVKSFFGSQGVKAPEVIGTAATNTGLYALLNNSDVRDQITKQACDRFGYNEDQLEFRLYVGKFAGAKTGQHEAKIRRWCSEQIVGGGPIRVVDVTEVAEVVRRVAESKTYRDNPALVATKVLAQAGMLTPLPSSGTGREQRTRPDQSR